MKLKSILGKLKEKQLGKIAIAQCPKGRVLGDEVRERIGSQITQDLNPTLRT